MMRFRLDSVETGNSVERSMVNVTCSVGETQREGFDLSFAENSSSAAGTTVGALTSAIRSSLLLQVSS